MSSPSSIVSHVVAGDTPEIVFPESSSLHNRVLSSEWGSISSPRGGASAPSNQPAPFNLHTHNCRHTLSSRAVIGLGEKSCSKLVQSEGYCGLLFITNRSFLCILALNPRACSARLPYKVRKRIHHKGQSVRIIDLCLDNKVWVLNIMVSETRSKYRFFSFWTNKFFFLLKSVHYMSLQKPMVE